MFKGCCLSLTNPYVEFIVFVSRTNAEGVVGSRIDAGGLDLEDVGGNGAFGGDAHVSMHNGEGHVTTLWLHHRTYTTTGQIESDTRKKGEGVLNTEKCQNMIFIQL